MCTTQNETQHRVGISLCKFWDAQGYQEEMTLFLGRAPWLCSG